MKFLPENSYHVFNQGNNHERLFVEDRHYHYFMELFQSYVVPRCHIICWCLMPNHFHFLIHTDTRVKELKKQGGLLLDPVTNGFRKLLSAYSHKYNLQNDRTGALFRPKTKSKSITDEVIIKESGLSNMEYFCQCFHYIHNNPVAANLTTDPGDWKWSSYRFYNGKRNNSFCNKNLAYKFLGIEEEQLKRSDGTSDL